MNLATCRTVASKMTDSDLRAIANSSVVHADAKRFDGRALEGLSEIVIAVCDEIQNRAALRAMYATGGCD